MNSCETSPPWENSEALAISDKLFLLCAPFTIFFNTLVIAIAFKYVNLSERLDQWFVINMSGANLLFGLVHGVQPFSSALPIWLCFPHYVVAWSCTASSVLFLLLLNIHKFITLFTPYRAERLTSVRIATCQIVFVWTCVIVYSSISAANMTIISNDPCYPCLVKSNAHLYAGMLFMFYVCPLLASLVISICIFALAQSKTRNPTGYRISEDKKTLKRIIFVFSYTVFTAVTFLPFRIGYSVFIICTLNGNTVVDCMSHEFQSVVLPLLYMLPFGSLINPLITIVTQKCYRVGVRNFYKSIIACFKCNREQWLRYEMATS